MKGRVLAMDNVVGDLFVGEAKIFFAHPRRQWRLPLRVETANTNGPSNDDSVSFNIHIHNSGLVMLCDSRMNAVRVTKELCDSNIGIDTEVRPYDTDNAGRWTNADRTSDGRHWSDGEYHWKRMLDANRGNDVPTSDQNAALSCLIKQLPPAAVEAVKDGRAIVVSRTSNLVAAEAKRCSGKDGNAVAHPITVRRVCKSFGNVVYALQRTPSHHTNHRSEDDDSSIVSTATIALLFVGKLWPKDAVSVQRPLLTVVRARSLKGPASPGGRVFCICLGDYLRRILDVDDIEGIAKQKRHYEGYFEDSRCESLKVK